MRFKLSLTRKRGGVGGAIAVGDRVQTLMLHLEGGAVGGSAMQSTRATLPARTTRATLSPRVTSIGDLEWLPSP